VREREKERKVRKERESEGNPGLSPQERESTERCDLSLLREEKREKVRGK